MEDSLYHNDLTNSHCPPNRVQHTIASATMSFRVMSLKLVISVVEVLKLREGHFLVSCPDHTSHKEDGLVNQAEFLGLLGLEAHYGMYNHCRIQQC